MKKGLLLLNLGTPSSPTPLKVARYLREFLCDGRVIDLPLMLRYLLFFGLIVPTRLSKTVQAYQRIWTPKGSPLLIHSQALLSALQQRLGPAYQVTLAMRYGSPHLNKALQTLADCDEVTILPLYPHYASASTGSALEAVLKKMSHQNYIPAIRLIHEFYTHSAYIKAQAAQIKPYLAQHDFVLFSYHGLPERQLICNKICSSPCPLSEKNRCYRAQCFQTSALIGKELNLNESLYDTAFQSRLGRIPWTKPYTELYLSALIQRGVKRLLVVCPSFTVDCLETLDEIGHLARIHWLELGGETLTLVPSLNSNELWIEALSEICAEV